MSHQESVYLDFVRLSAAIAVVVTHLIQYALFPSAWLNLVPDLGREAVIVFFVLSGYLIAYIAEEKYHALKPYLVSRATRLYSVALPVLLLAFIADSIGMKLFDGNYSQSYQYERFYLYIPFHLLFLGEVWTIAERPFSADPYWSLSFEAWYYVWFATLFYFSGWRRVVLFFLVAVIVGYQHWLLFPIWLSGVSLYYFKDRWRPTVSFARIGMLVTLLIVLFMEYSGVDKTLWKIGVATWPFPNLPQGSTDQYVLDYAICLCALVHLFCARHAALKLPEFIARMISAMAAYTFTLYLIHTVVMQFWQNNFEYDNNKLWHLLALCSIIVVVTFIVGLLTEKRRQLFKPPIEKGLNLLTRINRS